MYREFCVYSLAAVSGGGDLGRTAELPNAVVCLYDIVNICFLGRGFGRGDCESSLNHSGPEVRVNIL